MSDHIFIFYVSCGLLVISIYMYICLRPPGWHLDLKMGAFFVSWADKMDYGYGWYRNPQQDRRYSTQVVSL